MVTARDWSCGLIDHIILKDAACKIFSSVRRCETSHDGAFYFRRITIISSSPTRRASVQSNVVDFGINSLWENQTDIQTHVTKKEKFQQQCVAGAMECTVNGRYYSSAVMRWEKILHVLPLLSLIYADLFNRCFFFSYQCKSTPLQVWKDKKSHVNLLPLDSSRHCGPTSWPSLSRCDACRSVEGGSSSGRCLSWKIGRCVYRAHP